MSAARRLRLSGIAGRTGVLAAWVLCLVLALGPSTAWADAGQAKPGIAVEIPNALSPHPALLTGGQPTRKQLKEAADAGFRTVINFRGEREMTDWDEAALVKELGMAYVAIPVSGAQDLTRENVEAFDRELKKVGDGPILVHCASGNRVGAFFALRAFYVKGMSVDEAIAEGKASGLRSLEPAVREVMARP